MDFETRLKDLRQGNHISPSTTLALLHIADILEELSRLTPRQGLRRCERFMDETTRQAGWFHQFCKGIDGFQWAIMEFDDGSVSVVQLDDFRFTDTGEAGDK